MEFRLSTKKVKKFPFFIILLTFALSSLSATIIFPILAPLFFGESQTIIQAHIPENIRSILFGVFLAAFPLAQFLFAPLIGEYSDRKGRKKAFIVTLVLEVVGYLLAGAGIEYRHMSLLFIGRFISGLGAANFSCCLATLTDISYDGKSRARYFSYGSAVAGIMFILGPFLGGKLSDPTLSSFFNLAFPMWMGALFAFLNLILILFAFKETRSSKKESSGDPIKSIHNLQKALHENSTRTLYTVFFFFLFSWNMLYQFLPALLVEEFQATSSLIGDLSALMGIVWFVGTLTVSIVAHFLGRPKWALISSLIFFSTTVVFIPYQLKLYPFLIVTALSVFFAGGIWPILMGTISKISDPNTQGKTLGITQSVQSLSMMLAPVFGGFFLQAHSSILFICATVSSTIALMFLLRLKSSLFKV